MDFTANKFYVILFSLFEALFTIFTLFVLANRPLFAATKQCKSAQKHLSTKLEIKSKQILIGDLIGGVIGGAIGWSVYRQEQNAINEVIEQIEELTGEKE